MLNATNVPFPDVVIFDWDNTLVSSWGRLHESMCRTLLKFGKKPWSLQEAKQRMHMSSKDAFPMLFGQQYQEARDFFYQTYNDISHMHAAPLNGAVDTLNKLKNLGIKMCIISNKKGEILRSEVLNLKWDHFFESVIGSCDLINDKPDPITVWHSLEMLGLTKQAARWFVGDTIVDMQCAQNSQSIPIFFGELTEGATHPSSHNIEHLYALDHAEFQKIIDIANS